MMILRALIHYGLHFVLPYFIARKFYNPIWKKAWFLLTVSMIIDFDHLFSTPIFDPNRLSIGAHYLHSYEAIAIYILFLFFRKTRIFGIGLILHMLTDWQDYLWVLFEISS